MEGPEPETKEFLNTLWRLDSFETIGGDIIKPPKDQIYTIQFEEDGKFYGTNDCNDIGGDYEVKSDQSLIISKVGGSKVYCPNSMFLNYFNALEDANSYELQKNKLYIYYGINSRLNFIGE